MSGKKTQYQALAESERATRCDCTCHSGCRPACDIEEACCYLCICGAHVLFSHISQHREGCDALLRARNKKERRLARNREAA